VVKVRINPNAFGNALGSSLAEASTGWQRESATNVPKEFGLKPAELRLNKPDGNPWSFYALDAMQSIPLSSGMTDGISDGITQYADGSSRLANGRLVRPSVTAVQIPTEPGYVPSDSQLVTNDGRISTTLDGGGIYRTATGEQLDGLTRHTSYAAYVPNWMKLASGRPVNYSFDSKGTAFWNIDGNLAAIPVPYLRPTLSELDGHALWNGLSASPGQALDGGGL
jgi:hypothetical protein